MMIKNVVVLPGDGVGPEVADAVLMVLARTAKKCDVDLSIDTHLSVSYTHLTLPTKA